MTALSVIALLSACGGSSSEFSALRETGALTINDINDIGEEFEVVLSDIQSEGFTTLTTDELTAIGSATYRGLASAYPDGSDDVFVGRAVVDATFTGGGSVTGTVDNFALLPGGNADTDDLTDDNFDDDEDFVFEPLPADTEIVQIDGTLTLSNGSLSTVQGAGVMDIDVTGNVVVPGAYSGTGEEVDFAVSGSIDGVVNNTGLFGASGFLDADGGGAATIVELDIFATDGS